MPRNQSLRRNREAVIEAAEALVDKNGWTQLTMTALAASLGVRVPTLYSHVDSLEDLLRTIQIRAHAALGSRFQAAAAGRSGATGLRATAQALREYAIEHPGLYTLAMIEFLDVRAVLEAAVPSTTTLEVLVESFGVIDPPMDLIMNVVATLHGVIVLQWAGLFSGSTDTDAAYSRAIDMVIALLDREGTQANPRA